MRLLVCGGRDYSDVDFLEQSLDLVKRDHNIDVVIHGAARGADTLAGNWATKNNIPLEVYPAQWNLYGKSAGYKRNKQMLDEGKPDLVIAFPGGAGTRMMMRIAKEAGVEVLEISST